MFHARTSIYCGHLPTGGRSGVLVVSLAGDYHSRPISRQNTNGGLVINAAVAARVPCFRKRDGLYETWE